MMMMMMILNKFQHLKRKRNETNNHFEKKLVL